MRLADLIERGYQFLHPRDDQGRIVAVVGIRVHDSVIDMIRLEAEDDATALRLPGDEADVLAPRRVLWRSQGTARRVLDDLLTLADDAYAVPGRVHGCWVPGEHGRAKWLAATG
ncbi:hypothetical protein ORV05_33560 [Amycolatopsis cynarae]|uniref:Uncharacterized protein n=1 Tax=Amycolatopsis cynarae TaxID=2995223 RepID=A0ABY7B3D5_9PSEU|nr:hypothetical protein [Amycolatopsis sp. HUAS 11-8]WAL65737.1 hypothetical protein ORV05_33560 [Amycolatopsis sp. HUAS 11-8]